MIDRITYKARKNYHTINSKLAIALGLDGRMFHLGKNNYIALFHGIAQTSFTGFNFRFHGISDLEYIILHLKKRFNIVPLHRVFENNTSRNNKPSLALTFDDGYLNIRKYLHPLVMKHQVPVTVSICTVMHEEANCLWPDVVDIFGRLTQKKSVVIAGKEFIRNEQFGRFYGKNDNICLREYLKHTDFTFKKKVMDVFLSELDFRDNLRHFDYWKLLDENDIRFLSASGYFAIASHGHYHNNLANMSTGDAAAELKKSKTILESILQKEVDIISYPDGSYTREVIDEAQRLGYKYQLACTYLYHEDKEDQRILSRIEFSTDLKKETQLMSFMKTASKQ